MANGWTIDDIGKLLEAFDMIRDVAQHYAAQGAQPTTRTVADTVRTQEAMMVLKVDRDLMDARLTRSKVYGTVDTAIRQDGLEFVVARCSACNGILFVGRQSRDEKIYLDRPSSYGFFAEECCGCIKP